MSGRSRGGRAHGLEIGDAVGAVDRLQHEHRPVRRCERAQVGVDQPERVLALRDAEVVDHVEEHEAVVRQAERAAPDPRGRSRHRHRDGHGLDGPVGHRRVHGLAHERARCPHLVEQQRRGRRPAGSEALRLPEPQADAAPLGEELGAETPGERCELIGGDDEEVEVVRRRVGRNAVERVQLAARGGRVGDGGDGHAGVGERRGEVPCDLTEAERRAHVPDEVDAGGSRTGRARRAPARDAVRGLRLGRQHARGNVAVRSTPRHERVGRLRLELGVLVLQQLGVAPDAREIPPDGWGDIGECRFAQPRDERLAASSSEWIGRHRRGPVAERLAVQRLHRRVDRRSVRQPVERTDPGIGHLGILPP